MDYLFICIMHLSAAFGVPGEHAIDYFELPVELGSWPGFGHPLAPRHQSMRDFQEDVVLPADKHVRIGREFLDKRRELGRGVIPLDVGVDLEA